MPRPLPLSSNPNVIKHHSFQNKEKIKNWSKSPQNKELEQVNAVCFYHTKNMDRDPPQVTSLYF